MASSRFDICLDEVLRHEGGYADHPADPGGATNLGITHKTLARWRHVSPWWKLPKSAVQALQRPEAARIYRASYWDRCRAGSLPPGLDLALFDFAVNSGPDRAIRTLQAELDVAADGQIGPLTLAAVEAYGKRKGLGALISALRPAARFSASAVDFCRVRQGLDRARGIGATNRAGDGGSGGQSRRKISQLE